jgi:2-amino-4-hydroxy-6-hydroxymethyldihydropteridine diphosphokinase
MESKSGARLAGDVSHLDVVVGLGANLGSPEQTLRRAALELSQWGQGARLSKLYRSVPVAGPPQPDFLNAALRLRWAESAGSLLVGLQRLEQAAGRVRLERWGPRTLDLDILWVEGLELDEPGLIVPHLRLRERAFALRPLLDVAPDARDPRDGAPYARVLAELGASGIVPIDAAGAELSGEH